MFTKPVFVHSFESSCIYVWFVRNGVILRTIYHSVAR